VTTVETLPKAELDDELRHIQNLVFIRDLLRARGATADELEACDVVIEDTRARIATSARGHASHYAPAA
jgi:hypothetical protein